MLKKLGTALAALGLTASAVPAAAVTQPQVSFELRVGNKPEHFRRYFDGRRNFRHYPRCNRWEVAVRNPYRYNRYICVDREVYRQYWRGDRFDPRYDRYRR
jgi:hypothetical protein